MVGKKAYLPYSTAPVNKTAANAATATQNDGIISGMLVIGLAIGLVSAPLLARQLKGKTFAEAVTYLFELLGNAIILLVKPIKVLLSWIFSKTKGLPKK